MEKLHAKELEVMNIRMKVLTDRQQQLLDMNQLLMRGRKYVYHADKNSESHAELLLILLLLPNFSIILDKSHSQYMKMLLLLAKSAYDAYKKIKKSAYF